MIDLIGTSLRIKSRVIFKNLNKQRRILDNKTLKYASAIQDINFNLQAKDNIA